jgi:uncharacterized protein (TIGR03382 family)
MLGRECMMLRTSNEVSYNTRVDLLSGWIDAQLETYDPGFRVGAVEGEGDGGRQAAPRGGPGALTVGLALVLARRRRRT